MAAKKKASVRGEKRFRAKRPRPIRINVVKELRCLSGCEAGCNDPVVPLETQDPPLLRVRERDFFWRLPE